MAMKFTNSDSLFSRIFERVFDLIILNILWVLCCVPVVTAGASTAALYYMTMKMARGENFAVIKDFIKAFRQNFVKATLMWIFILLPGATLAMGYYYIYMQGSAASMGSLVIALCCSVLYLLLITCLFPLQARFENAVAPTIVNSFILGVRYFPKTLLVWVCWLVPLLLTVWSVTYMAVMALLWLLFGVSAIAWVTSIIYTKIFDAELARGQSADESGSSEETAEVELSEAGGKSVEEMDEEDGAEAEDGQETNVD